MRVNVTGWIAVDQVRDKTVPTPGFLKGRAMIADTVRLDDLRDQILAGERLTFDDGMFLEAHADLFTLGRAGQYSSASARTARHLLQRQRAPQSDQRLRLSLLLLLLPRRFEERRRATSMTDEQILDRAREADRRGCTELHIVGGLHHQLPYDWYLGHHPHYPPRLAQTCI